MSYQALARQWRPKTFSDMVGQSHVVIALKNALDRGRVHHAYLFTGTRGVGKTTIARILAKSLNCDTGVTASPCGQCATCVAIDEGRFVDLLELDAASNTGVDNMREILDNARYAPTAGRIKVYLIDEVHMLSGSAFNSMLKTLEEPPDHVKFILATTDPQKVPITVLSRCLQFSLKALPADLILARLSFIMNEEKIAFEPAALAMIARAARGSLRDALSLLDQAVAYGGGSVEAAGVALMLGATDHEAVYRLLHALLDHDGKTLLDNADAMIKSGAEAQSVIEALAALFHRVAVVQVVPEAAENFEDAVRLKEIATRVSPETIQLFYDIAIKGRAELNLAPDETMGLSMTLLRLLAFAPASSDHSKMAVDTKAVPPLKAAAPAKAEAKAATEAKAPAKASPAPAISKVEDKPQADTISDSPAPKEEKSEADFRAESPVISEKTPTPTPTQTEAIQQTLPTPDTWGEWHGALKMPAMAAQLAQNTALLSIDTGSAENHSLRVSLALPKAKEHLKTHEAKLKKAMEEALDGRRVHLVFQEVAEAKTSLAAQKARAREARDQEISDAFRNAPFVQALTEKGGEIVAGSVKATPKEGD